VPTVPKRGLARVSSCPDDDFILSAVAKLPVEIWRDRYRKVLEPFFDIREGHWFHKRIERELRNGHRRHTQTVNATEAAWTAREARKVTESTVRSTQRTPLRTPLRTGENVTDNVTDSVTDNATINDTGVQKQKHSLITREREARARGF
jgi:uncharacterized protein YdaU (DUF1376 family)